MASEIGFDAGPGLTGITAYAMLRNASQQVYNTAGAAFEAYNAANITDYDIALTEQGSSGYFVGNMPAVAAGLYTLTVKQQAGGSPAVSDTRIGGGEGDWNGTAFQSVATIAGYLDTEVAAILADTNELQTDWADGGRLDLILDARASQTSVDDLPTNAELATAIITGLTTALTEGYRGTGATGSVRDLLYEIIAHLGNSGIAGVTKTLKKLDTATTAKTYTLDDANTPTAIVEAS